LVWYSNDNSQETCANNEWSVPMKTGTNCIIGWISLLSWCILETNMRSWHRKSPTKRMLHTSPRISHSIVLTCISKDTIERTLPTKGCPIWYAIFVVESFYNLKVRLVNIWVSGKGIIWRSLLTRDVSISIKSMTTKALLFTVHYKVYSNYVFKSVYKLYKKLNRDGVEVMDIWYMVLRLWIYDYRYLFVDIRL